MNAKKFREELLEAGYDDFALFENFGYDDALVGISEDGRAIYDYEKMVEWLVEKENMSVLDAIEWIDSNTIPALSYFSMAGYEPPIIMYKADDLPVSECFETDSEV